MSSDRPFVLQPVTLRGSRVILEPLAKAHASELREVAFSPELWRIAVSVIANDDDLARYIQDALDAQAAGTALPFLTRDAATGKAIGSTRFANASPRDLRVEIGWTWLSPPYWGTRANVEAKLLMLTHAFDTLGCNRVELKTDLLNLQSQKAMEKIGATREGVMRRHTMTWSGRARDSVYYSIISEEWPAVRDRLQSLLR